MQKTNAVACAGIVCDLREGLGTRRGSVQDLALHSDRHTRQHDVYFDCNERRPLSGHMPAAESRIHIRSDVKAESHDIHRVDRSINLCHASAVHFQTGLQFLCQRIKSRKRFCLTSVCVAADAGNLFVMRTVKAQSLVKLRRLYNNLMQDNSFAPCSQIIYCFISIHLLWYSYVYCALLMNNPAIQVTLLSRTRMSTFSYSTLNCRTGIDPGYLWSVLNK